MGNTTMCQIGLLIEPCLALSSTFCLQGLAPPPETSDLVFVEAALSLIHLINPNILVKTFILGSKSKTLSFSSICSTFSPLDLIRLLAFYLPKQKLSQF